MIDKNATPNGASCTTFFVQLDSRELTRVLILELGHIVDVLVNDDPQAIALAVGGDVVLAEGLRHGDCKSRREGVGML